MFHYGTVERHRPVGVSTSHFRPIVPLQLCLFYVLCIVLYLHLSTVLRHLSILD